MSANVLAHDRPWQLDWLRTAVVLTSGPLIAAVALTLLARRGAGALQPLPALTLLMVGGVLVVSAQVWRLGWQASVGSADRDWRFWLGSVAPAITLLCFAVALSIAGTSVVALTLFWWLMIVTEGLTLRLAFRPTQQPGSTLPAPTVDVANTVEEEEPESLLPAKVSQQLTRQMSEGVESLTCLVRVSFASGEQTQTVHIAFCPPLEGELTSHCEHVDGAACEIKTSLVESFGARLEVKRRGPLNLLDEAIVLLEVQGS